MSAKRDEATIGVDRRKEGRDHEDEEDEEMDDGNNGRSYNSQYNSGTKRYSEPDNRRLPRD